MTETEQWYAARKFKGIGTDGKTRDYTRGDAVSGVEKWPTFNSLKNIGWIVPHTPKISAKPNRPKPPEQPEPQKVEDDKSENLQETVTEPTKKPQKKAKTRKQSKAGEFVCDICGKSFKTGRALKVHMRYH